jgi:hypothetical protein
MCLRLLSTLVFLLAVVTGAVAGPKRISDYGSLFAAAKAGHSIRIVVEYEKTLITVDGKEVPAPKAIGGVELDAWEWFDKGVVRNEKAYIATSHTVLISHPRYGHVYNYVRFRIFEDGYVEITAKYLKPDTFEAVMEQVNKGAISSGKDQKAVSFFKLD